MTKSTRASVGVTGNPRRRVWSFPPDFHFDIFVNRSTHELSKATHEAIRVYCLHPSRPSLHPLVFPLQEQVVPITTHMTAWLAPCIKALASTVINEYHLYLRRLSPAVREALFSDASKPPEDGEPDTDENE